MSRPAHLLLLFLTLCLLLSPVPRGQTAERLPRDVWPDRGELEGWDNIFVADEQFISGTVRGEQAVRQFLEQEQSFLREMKLEPVAQQAEMAADSALALFAEAYSVSPSLLLTLAEQEHGVFSEEAPRVSDRALSDWFRQTAVALSRWFYDYYYGGAGQQLVPGGEPVALEAGNGATYALRAYFLAQLYQGGEPLEQLAAWERETAALYEHYFGPALAGRLRARQPSAVDRAALPRLKLPWLEGDSWYFTGGPHNLDGSKRRPLSGVDFQPVGLKGCNPEVGLGHPVAASAAGRTVDYQSQWLKLDHDGDADVFTGWQTVYGHLAYRTGDDKRVRQGMWLGYPSCRGGFASGVHVHFGVKFENVWQPIDEMTLSGWQIVPGEESYSGTMLRDGDPERRSCFRVDEPFMDCTHALLVSDNKREGVSNRGRFEAR